MTSQIVFALYKPHNNKENELKKLISEHVPIEIYTKFDELELKKDFPIEASRLCDGGQELEDSHESYYNYGKA